ncbi:uncharacterized protein [Pseudorasbora parva]|uniref:uncharacterized protein n=1 Tax=Pseudorasbora parva TaxID=51549 RepID=UPI00351DF019
MTDFQEIELFPSDDELSNVPETPARFSPNTLDPPSRHISPVDRPGRRSLRSTSQHQKPRSRRHLSPPPSRSSRGSADPRHDSPRPPASSSSSSSSLPSSSAASPSVPPVKKWTVNALRQALSNAGIHFSRKSSKAQLHDLLMRSHQNTQRPASSMQTSTQATVRSIRFASNPRQIQPAAAAATASLSAAESGRVSVAAANISSAVSSDSSTAAPTVNVTFPPATARVTQWNQCPYWGALDLELYNKVFLGCRNVSCVLCSSATHEPSSCPLFNPTPPSNTGTNPGTSQIAHELANHPDKNFTQYLLKCLDEGFNPGLESLPTSSLICKNLQSANAEPEAVDTLIVKELESGFMIGPFDSPPFKLFRISPIGVATRKFSGKKRMIIDLSAPHNNTQPSINSLIPLEEFSLCYHNIDQAIHLIKNAGYGAWLAKVDITSAFKVMPIHPDFWHLFGIRWRGKFFFAVRLTFGCKSSPRIFDMLSEALCWILQNNHAVPYLVQFLDDFLTVSPSFFPPAAHLSTIQNVFSTLGVPLSPEKTQGPTKSLEFLGINLDSVKFQASLPKDKIDRIIAISSNLLEAPQCSKRDLLSLLGHLNYAMRIVPQGRPFISHLLSLASSIQELDNTISLTPSCLTDLKLWIMFLKQWIGLTFFYDDFLSQPCDLPLFTDAAPSVGFGGFYKTHWFASTWPPELSMSNQQTASSALFELYPIIVAAHLWGHEWSSKNIVMHCDNLATVHCINKGLSKSPKIMPLLRRLTWLSACNQFTFKAVHIPGHQNQIADALSRLLFQKFRALAPEADPNPTPIPPYSDLTFQ